MLAQKFFMWPIVTSGLLRRPNLASIDMQKSSLSPLITNTRLLCKSAENPFIMGKMCTVCTER